MQNAAEHMMSTTERVEAALALPRFRSRLCQKYRQRLERTAQDIPAALLYRPTVVFAPHQDDEALACGGTILRLRQLDVPVSIVFMTDGAQSHGDRYSREDLARRREAEGLAAANRLGVAADDVYMLCFTDGALAESAVAAEARVGEILAQRQPGNVFAPFERDTTPDHIATHAIVRRAVQTRGPAIDFWAYPIWFWAYWPWCPWTEMPGRTWRWRLRRVVQSHRYLRRWRRWRVDVAALREAKLAALAAHDTQVRRADGDPSQPMLGDLWNGNFLACSFGAHELFAHVWGDGVRRS